MLSMPKVKSTKHGLSSFRYFAAKKLKDMECAAGFDSRHGRHKGICIRHVAF